MCDGVEAEAVEGVSGVGDTRMRWGVGGGELVVLGVEGGMEWGGG